MGTTTSPSFNKIGSKTKKFYYRTVFVRVSFFLTHPLLYDCIVHVLGRFNAYLLFFLNRLDSIILNVEVIGYLLETLKDPYELLKDSAVLKMKKVGDFYKWHVEGLEFLF